MLVTLFPIVLAGISGQGEQEDTTRKWYRSYSLKQKIEVIAYAEVHGNNAATRKFGLSDPKRVREWQQNKDKLAVCESDHRKRKRIKGGCRKPKYTDLEDELLLWINEKREQGLQVSRKIIMAKTKGLYDEKYKIDETVNAGEEFKVSRGWLEKFFSRNGLCLRRKTTEAQKDPPHLVDKLVSYKFAV